MVLPPTSESVQTSPAIRARGVSKFFGGAMALSGVDLDVLSGQVHAVVGENGAGKSTLMRVLAGLIAPDEGTVECFGAKLESSTASARAAGIALVHQERSLVPQLSVAENICLGTTPTRGGFVDRREQYRVARELLARVGVTVNPASAAGRLSSAQQQFVEIAKALRQQPRVLILDEPSASLTPLETERLLTLLRSLTDDGLALVYISHRLPEVFALCQSVTVLRDGNRVGSYHVADITSGELVHTMVGRALDHDLSISRQAHTGKVALEATRIQSAAVKDVSLTVHSREIVGLGGLVGAGRTELIRAIVGLDPRTSGAVRVAGRDGGSHRLETYVSAVRHGVAFLPEERRNEGVVIDMSIQENLTLPTRARTSRAGVANRRERASQADDMIKQLDIHPADKRKEVGLLSGGNQQKVAFGKWLPAEPTALILDEPTRDVDVGAKTEIHNLIRSLADRGAAVLFVSSDLPELLALADRILVVRDGAVVGEVDGEQATEPTVMSMAVGQQAEVGSGAS